MLSPRDNCHNYVLFCVINLLYIFLKITILDLFILVSGKHCLVVWWEPCERLWNPHVKGGGTPMWKVVVLPCEGWWTSMWRVINPHVKGGGTPMWRVVRPCEWWWNPHVKSGEPPCERWWNSHVKGDGTPMWKVVVPLWRVRIYNTFT